MGVCSPVILLSHCCVSYAVARGYPIKPEMRPRPVPAPSLPLPVHSAVAPQLPIKPEDQRGIAGGGFKKVCDWPLPSCSCFSLFLSIYQVLGIPGSGMQSMRVGGPAPVQSAAVQGSPAVGGGVGIGGEGGGMVEVEGTAAVQTPPLKPSAGFIIRSVPSPIDPSAILTNAPANPSPPVTAPA